MLDIFEVKKVGDTKIKVITKVLSLMIVNLIQIF